MSWLDGLKHRVRTLMRPGTHERDVADEMRFHLELDASHDPAAASAPGRFGNRTYYKEEVRRQTWLGTLDVARQDLGYAWRATRRSPGFTAVVVLTLALGIGVNGATFSVLDRFYLRPPRGIEDPSSLRRMWIARPGSDNAFPSQSISFGAYNAIAAATGSRDNMALYATDYAMRLGKRPTDPRVGVVYATASYFPVLGVRPALGRVYSADEDRVGGKPSVAVVSHAFWRNRLGGDSAALGRTIAIGTDAYVVVGVLDRRFTGLDLRAAEVWLPLGAFSAGWAGDRWWANDGASAFTSIRRATPAVADAEFDERATAYLRAANRGRVARAATLATISSGSI